MITNFNEVFACFKTFWKLGSGIRCRISSKCLMKWRINMNYISAITGQRKVAGSLVRAWTNPWNVEDNRVTPAGLQWETDQWTAEKCRKHQIDRRFNYEGVILCNAYVSRCRWLFKN